MGFGFMGTKATNDVYPTIVVYVETTSVVLLIFSCSGV
jgi:hypothetical protein